MTIAIRPDEVFDYVLEADQDEDPNTRTVFELRRLSPPEMAQVLTRLGPDPMGSPVLHEVLLDLCRATLVGWRNLRYEDGQEAPFHFATKERNIFGKGRKIPSDQTLGHLDLMTRGEIGMLPLTKHVAVSDDDQKN